MKQNKAHLTPLLKWPGGKSGELEVIRQAMPEFKRFYEPFVGGGAVYFGIEGADAFFINDKSSELVELYRKVAAQDVAFHGMLNDILSHWKYLEGIVDGYGVEFVKVYEAYADGGMGEQKLKDWVCEFVVRHHAAFRGMFSAQFNTDIENFIRELNRNLYGKMRRMKAIELERDKLLRADLLSNIEAALKSAFYMHFRYLYNNIERLKISDSHAAAIYFFIRNYAYSSMFRYNGKGEFNVPYGGIGYNRVNFEKKIEYLHNDAVVKRLQNSQIESMDFGPFMAKHKPLKDDFIFLDPPYDSEFSTYAQNTFTREDQQRLADYLLGCEAKWMLVIKHTEFIRGLYDRASLNVSSFDKNYLVSFKNRNDRNVQHLMIRNY